MATDSTMLHFVSCPFSLFVQCNQINNMGYSAALSIDCKTVQMNGLFLR